MSKINGAKAGEFLYEEVLERNFEIIESFLSKFHTVFESITFLKSRTGFIRPSNLKDITEDTINREKECF